MARWQGRPFCRARRSEPVNDDGGGFPHMIRLQRKQMTRAAAAACFVANILSRGAFAQPAVHVPPYPRIENTIGYKVDPAWPIEKPPGGDWAAMSSVAMGSDGNVGTFNRG